MQENAPERACFLPETALIFLACAASFALPYLYASGAENYFHNTALDFPRAALGASLKNAATNSYYPPLYHLWLAVWVDFFDLRYPGAVLASVPFVLMAAGYLAAIGRRLGDPRVGWAAAFCFLTLPGTAMALSSTVRDVPLAAFAAGTVFHALRSGGFRHRGHAVAAGALAGLGMLTKWTFPIYILGWLPVIVRAVILRPATQDDEDAGGASRHGPLTGLLTAALAAALVCGWWYAKYLDLDTLRATVLNDPSLPRYTYGGMLGTVAAMFFGGQLRWFWWPLAAAGLVAGLARRSTRNATASAVASVLAAVLVFSAFVHTEDRYLFACLPWAALTIGAVTGIGKTRAVRAAVALCLVAVGVLGYADTFLADRTIPPDPGVETFKARCDQYQVGGRLPWIRDRGNRELMEAVESHNRAHHPESNPVVVVVPVKHPRCLLAAYALRLGLSDPRGYPFVQFLEYGNPTWIAQARTTLQGGDPVYVLIEEHVESATDRPEDKPFLLDPRSGAVWPEVTAADRDAFRRAVRERLPKVAEVAMPAIGTVGIYYRAPGAGVPLDDLCL